MILDADFNVVAQPFPKFFNYEEHKPEEIPTDETFIVMDKMDGSLGILYWIGEIPYIATRGSFTSDQSVKATQMLHTTYKHTWGALKEISDNKATVLFEIIYPENRIVLDYGGKEELVLLSIKENTNNLKDVNGDPSNPYFNFIWHQDLGFPVVKRYDGVKDFTKLKELNEENKEGFVIRFSKKGFMVKIKFAEYVRLHRILTQTSSKVIWEFMKDGKPMDEILEKIPDEFYDWVKKTKEDLETKFAQIETDSKFAFIQIMTELCFDYGIDGINWVAKSSTPAFKEAFKKKDFALKVMDKYKNISGILFNMIDKRDYKEIIFKMIRPEYERPFKNAGQIEA